MILGPDSHRRMVEAILLERFAGRGCSEDEAREVAKAIVSVCTEESASEKSKPLEALFELAFGNSSEFAADPFKWPSTKAYLALGGRIKAGRRLDDEPTLRALSTRPSPSHDGGRK